MNRIEMFHDDTLGTDDEPWQWPEQGEVFFNSERAQWEAVMNRDRDCRHCGFHDTRDDAYEALRRARNAS